MGSDDLFKKRREDRRKRKCGDRPSGANSILIVTEGKCTEPLYFGGMVKRIKEKMGGNVDVVEIPVIDIRGEGCSTGKLIEKTEEIVARAPIIYQEIWVVFDKDDFADFDSAIDRAKEKGYHVAWSNPSFEYWLYLHFNYNDSNLHRHDWNEKLNEIFLQRQLGEGKYQKNYKDIYDIVDRNDGVNTAIRNAKKRMANYNHKKCRPSNFAPGCTVYLLVEMLKRYIDE